MKAHGAVRGAAGLVRSSCRWFFLAVLPCAALAGEIDSATNLVQQAAAPLDACSLFADGGEMRARAEAAQRDAATGMVARAVAPSALAEPEAAIVSTELVAEPSAEGLAEGLRRVEVQTEATLADGTKKRIPTGRAYYEVAAGLTYVDAGGARQLSKVEPVLAPDGTVRFDKLPFEVRFAGNANLESVVEFHQRGTAPARSAVAGLAYVDETTGRRVVIDEVTDSAGVVTDDGAYYTNAFGQVDADILYKVRPWGVEQDIVIYGGLPHPKRLGLDLERTWLCVLTELVDLDWSKVGVDRGVPEDAEQEIGPSDRAPDPLEVSVHEGGSWKRIYNWQRCYAYPEDGTLMVGGQPAEETEKHPVHMQLFQSGGRVFLSEEVPLAEAAGAAYERLAGVDEELEDQSLAEVPRTRPVLRDLAEAQRPLRTASYAARGEPRYVIDYVHYAGTNSLDITFRSNQTYFISSDLVLNNGRLTIEPGACVKFAPNSQIKLQNNTLLRCRTHALNPALFTSAYDTNGAGEAIVGYVGDPATNKYTAGLVVEAAAPTISGLRVRYAKKGIELNTSGSQPGLWHMQFEQCDQAIVVTAVGAGGTLVGNNLIRDGGEGVRVSAKGADVRNVTWHHLSGAALVAAGTATNIAVCQSFFSVVTNTVFSSNVAVTVTFLNNARYLSPNGYAGSNALTVSSNPFLSGAQGDYYLRQTSALINAGAYTASLSTVRLYHFTTATNHVRETNSIADIGFHYPTTGDFDGDGLYDFVEDTTGDGANSYYADLAYFTTNDTDGDLLNDYAEFMIYNTSPYGTDSDYDGLWDGLEVQYGSDPTNASSRLYSAGGSITYSGPQTGPVRVAITSYAQTTNRPAMDQSFDANTGNAVYDNTAYDNFGAVRGAAWEAGGIQGGCYYFDGGDDIVVGDLPVVEGQSNLTWGAWVKVDNETWLGGVMGKTVANNESFYLNLDAASSNMNAYIVPEDRSEERGANKPGAITNGVWQYVCGVYNSAQVFVYINGQLAGTSIVYASKTVRSNNVTAAIGDVAAGRGWFFNGRIDELHIYQQALGSNELRGLYLGAAGLGLRREATQTYAGAYSFTNMPTLSNYWVSAWLDGNGNGRKDFYEPAGYYAGNGFSFTNAITNANVVLAHPDTDGDGSSDLLELQTGTDPIRAASYPAALSGSIAYTGGQSGPIRVMAGAEPGLLLHYDFDANQTNVVMDQSGRGRTGTISGAAYSTNGYRGGAYTFDGTNDYILAGNLGLVATGAMAFWMNADVVENYRSPLSSDFASGNDCLRFEALTGGRFAVYGDGLTNSQYFLTNMAASTWYHVLLCWSRTNLWGYLNGAKKFEAGHSGLYPPGLNLDLNNLAIGNGYSLSMDRYWRGRVDEVKVYNRALSAAEATNLYLTGVAATNLYTATLLAPGLYTISDAPNQRRYTLTAYRDSNTNGLRETAEACGTYSGNPIQLNTSATNLNLALTDPDTDGDGMPDWWETLYGLNPTSSVPGASEGWWKFDEGAGTNVTNSAGAAYWGNTVNMTTSSWVSGKMGGALNFNGTNQYVRIPQTPAIITGGQFTASAWAYYEPSAPSSWPAIMADRTNCGGLWPGFWLGYHKGIPGPFGAVGSCSAADSVAGYGYPSTGAWVHVSVVEDAAAYVRLYINGVQIQAFPGGFSAAQQAELTIGWENITNTTTFWKGKLDDVRLFKSGLSSNAIYTMYDALWDLDGDGYTSLQEYQAGTSPNQSNPAPLITIISPRNGGVLP